MDSDKLLDAIGMVDDDLLVQEKRTVIPFRRKLIVLVAAVLILALSAGVVAAEEGDFQQLRQEIEALKPRKAAKKNDAEE